MSFFHILQVSTLEQIKKITDKKVMISFPANRFLEYTDEKIRIFYKELTSENLQFLKKYPALITIEVFQDNIYLTQIENVTYLEESEEIEAHLNIIKILPIQQREDIDIKKDDSREVRKVKFENFENYIEDLRTALNFEKLEEFRNHWAIKSGDIFHNIESFSQFRDQFSEYTTPLPLPQFISPAPIEAFPVESTFELETTSTQDTAIKDDKIDNYENEITIETVSDYIALINKLNKENDLENRELFFRGHSDAQKYFLKPSLFRQYKKKGPIYLEDEKKSFSELLSTEARYFSNEIRCFDILTHMQHYSFPTRLLDISSNPLAALYFACEIKKDNEENELNIDGQVVLFYIKKSEIKYYDSDTVSCISNLAKLSHAQKEDLLEITKKYKPINPFLDDTTATNELTYSQLIHYIQQEKPYFEPKIRIDDLIQKVICVKGRLNQERIIAQSGSFLLFGIDGYLPENGNEIFKIVRINIKSEKKHQLLAELDLLQINLRTIYPSLENTAKYLKEKLELEADSK